VSAADVTIIGKRILNVRPMTPAEKKNYCWSRGGVALELEDGITLYPSRDEEGNGPGVIFGTHPDCDFVVGCE
jgi:hypothetical protein